MFLFIAFLIQYPIKLQSSQSNPSTDGLTISRDFYFPYSKVLPTDITSPPINIHVPYFLDTYENFLESYIDILIRNNLN